MPSSVRMEIIAGTRSRISRASCSLAFRASCTLNCSSTSTPRTYDVIPVASLSVVGSALRCRHLYVSLGSDSFIEICGRFVNGLQTGGLVSAPEESQSSYYAVAARRPHPQIRPGKTLAHRLVEIHIYGIDELG